MTPLTAVAVESLETSAPPTPFIEIHFKSLFPALEQLKNRSSRVLAIHVLKTLRQHIVSIVGGYVSAL